ncbi:MAG: hypothetical protein UU09_C0043G0001, partial [Microgenomates group bacterium GW2011_GWA2_40_6]
MTSVNINNFQNHQLLANFIAALKRNHTPASSISRKLSSLKSFQKFLVKKKKILSDQNPPIRLNVGSPPLKKGGFSFNRYFVFATLALIILGSLYGLYTQTITKAKKELAYSSASSPVIGSRILSFQGRLTDTSGNPIIASTGILFKLFSSGAGGTELYSSDTGNSQVVVPDDNGIFNTIIGKSHGDTIPSTVFTEHSEVWLQITVDAETMTPRQQIATVAYAMNAETLQGLPPSASGFKNTVLVVGESGNVYLGETSPSIISTSGTFGIEGQALLLKASDGSGGNITINPDGNGVIRFVTEGTTPSVGGFIDASNANLATGNLYNAQINNTNRGYNFINFSNYDSGTTNVSTRFSIGASGNLFASGNLTIGGTPTFSSVNISTGTTALFIDTSGIITQRALGALAFSDSAIGTTYAFASGLTNSSNTISLGGTLSQSSPG